MESGHYACDTPFQIVMGGGVYCGGGITGVAYINLFTAFSFLLPLSPPLL
jgi:hypothetical protein